MGSRPRELCHRAKRNHRMDRNPVVNVEKMTKRRLAAEKSSIGVGSRVEGLRNFIKRIKLTRKRLRKRIISVNALFKLKFDENMANVGAATCPSRHRSPKAAPYNPKLNKIKQFKSFDTDTTSLIQMTEKAMNKTCAKRMMLWCNKTCFQSIPKRS